jgi:hypothetical protein
MRLYSIIGFSGLLLASNITYSAMPAYGWYGGVFAGPSYATNQANFSFRNPFTGNIATGNLSYDVLANGGLQVGYRCEHFHVEGELVYNANYYNKLSFDDITFTNNSHGSGPRIKGYVSFLAGFINGYFDLFAGGNDTCFSPYVGLGIGYAGIQNNPKLRCRGADPICDNFINLPQQKESAGAAMGQGIIGLNYWLDDFSSIALDYRYISTLSRSRSGNVTSINNAQLQVQTLNFVFNFAFDGIY